MRYLFFIVVLTAVITAGCINTIPTQIFRPDTTKAEFGSAYSDSEQAVTVFSAQKTKTFTSKQQREIPLSLLMHKFKILVHTESR